MIGFMMIRQIRLLKKIVFGIIICGIISPNAWGQLTVKAPVDGIKVTPGAVIMIEVSKTPGSPISTVALTGDLLDKPSSVKAWTEPMIFPLTVSRDKRPGTYRLAVVDATPGRSGINPEVSEPIHVSVQSGFRVTSIIAVPESPVLRYPGDERHVQFVLQGTDGTETEITNSPEVSYRIDNADVVKIRNGTITANNAGTATISISYLDFKGNTTSMKLPVIVPTLIPGDLDGNKRVDVDDLNEILAANGQRAKSKNDARDLNHDGKIDALDARILSTLCTYPNCQTHP